MAQPAIQACTSDERQHPFRSEASERGTKRFLAALQPDSLKRAGLVRDILRSRSRRGEHFGASLFSDPAWDLLLVLYQMELEQRRISIGGLCQSAGVAGTTGLRWIDILDGKRLIERHADPLDGRRVYIRLSFEGLSSMHAYFSRDHLFPGLLRGDEQ